MTVSRLGSMRQTGGAARVPAPRHGTIVALAASLSLVVAGVGWGAATYAPANDMNSMLNTTTYSGARAWWKAGYTGKGVGVAVIDTGVNPVAGLDTAGKIVYGPDLSLESQAPNLRRLDTNGHGTFMAGIIAGRASAAVPGRYANDSVNFLGVAPDARIVSIKVGTADGGADVSQVIAAIDWVVQHKDDKGLNIRVLNLSYGTDSAQDYRLDPLAYAVEQAWNAGIFVVAATGNDGYVARTGTLTNPALDPTVFAVGASDSMGTDTLVDDEVAGFSSTGSPSRYVDVVAPGSHIVSLRVPNSYVDRTYGATGTVTSTLFRGSGTSEAAAFVSGAAALAIEKYPTIDPLTLKYFFRSGTRVLGCAGCSQSRQGQGEVDLAKMLDQTPYTKKGALPKPALGNGSLELARGSEHLTRDGVPLAGEVDIFGKPFDTATMASLEAAGNSWSGGTWNGSAWSGNSWSGNSWSGNTWSGSSWSGSSWSSSTWSGNTWSGSSWSGGTWSGSSWSGSSWSGNSWSGASWS